jgi:bifunctional non-homologous end joining protein LigD
LASPGNRQAADGRPAIGSSAGGGPRPTEAEARRALPGWPIAPMMAIAAASPPADDERWAFEVKYDGVRALSFVSPGEVRLQSRTLRDITPRYPELSRLGSALGRHDAVLDGEVVAFDESGQPSFHRLQDRMHLADPHLVARRARSVPVVYLIFDLLHLDGRSSMALPYGERRELLASLGLDDGCWRTASFHVGDGPRLLEACRSQGLEGLVAKRLNGSYEPGRRSGSWLKLKNTHRQEFVVGGWLEGQGGRRGRPGSLLVGCHENGHLRYAGRVGSGLSDRDLRRLGRRLAELASPETPFQPPASLPPATGRGAHFVRPELVVEVSFTSLSADGVMRHPVYLGERDDAEPAAVVREQR